MFRIITIENQKEVQDFFGLHDENCKLIEHEYDVKISLRADGLKVSASNKGKMEKAVHIIENFLQLIRTNRGPQRRDLELMFPLKGITKSMSPNSLSSHWIFQKKKK